MLLWVLFKRKPVSCNKCSFSFENNISYTENCQGSKRCLMNGISVFHCQKISNLGMLKSSTLTFTLNFTKWNFISIPVKEEDKELRFSVGEKHKSYNGFIAYYSTSMGSLSIASSSPPKMPFLIFPYLCFILICIAHSQMRTKLT